MATTATTQNKSMNPKSCRWSKVGAHKSFALASIMESMIWWHPLRLNEVAEHENSQPAAPQSQHSRLWIPRGIGKVRATTQHPCFWNRELWEALRVLAVTFAGQACVVQKLVAQTCRRRWGAGMQKRQFETRVITKDYLYIYSISFAYDRASMYVRRRSSGLSTI